MKRILFILLTCMFATGMMAQSVLVEHSLTAVENSAVLVQYNNYFGSFNNPDMDDPFPYVVIRVELLGDVTVAKERLDLNLGSQYKVESAIRSEQNQILFLVSSNVRNIELLCGDGCTPTTLIKGRLRKNTVYTCKVRYTAPAVSNQSGASDVDIKAMEAKVAELSAKLEGMEKQKEVPENREKMESTNTQPTEKKKTKIQFNPTPSDNYAIGLTVGYVSKQFQYNGDKWGYGKFFLGEGNRTDYTPALQLGITYNPTFKYGIGIRTGVFLEYARDVFSQSYDNDIYSGELNDLVLSMPAQLSYRYEIIKNLSVMLYTGPVIDFGMVLNAKIKFGAESETLENRYQYKDFGLDNDEKKYSGFDCQWGIGAGVQWSRLRLDIGGSFGMVNRISVANPKVMTNKPVYVTLTCFF